VVAPRESKEGTEAGQVVKIEDLARTKRRKRVAVSIQKGKLLFLPGAVEKTVPRPSDESKSSDSEEN
jgi:hypothetical protein